MVDIGEIVSNVDLRVPPRPLRKLLRTAHGGMRPFARPTRIGIENQGTVQNRPHPGHQRMMQNALPETGGVDQAGFRISDAETTHVAQGIRAIEDAGAQRRKLRVQIGSIGFHIRSTAFAEGGAAKGRPSANASRTCRRA